ncbi:DUF1524 domain-containing protein [Citricoccus sp. SGAir0253]|uniref:GmrSD restriction endonuclease domain-containing protein n=1 Tax=Citricoccus sp. SGAir0253 TaxID=2567881 RepID=UPI0010CCD197|nr:DUF1524 domain-containing protein [Citricoccus sp. SGAir0253]QCU78553.1 DUF1524 domain-containing protein [Citricoccus sp. SGAir0253]
MGSVRSTTVPAASLALVLALAGCTGTGPSAESTAPATAAPASSAAMGSPTAPSVGATPESSPESASGSTAGPAGGGPTPSSPAASTASASPSASPSETPSAAPTGDVASPGTALAALEGLPVKGRAPRTGYDRLQFGPAWADTDHDGCDTRNDILERDLREEAFRPGTHDCVVLSGVLDDPYTATEIHFLRGQDTSNDVQVDHVVALSDAWQKGAQALDTAERTEFANDPLNLLAVDGPANAQKGDSDAATWLPANTSFRCDYVARQVAVKARYALWVTAAEREAMAGVLAGCPGQSLPTGQTASRPYEITTHATRSPTPAPAGSTTPSLPEPDPAPTSAGSTGPEDAPAVPPSGTGEDADATDPRFGSCTKAKAAGYGPYVAGTDAEYAWYRDGDGDGITCE